MLKDRLEAFGAVLIEGPKWTGKTTTALQQAESVLQLQDPDHSDDTLATAATMPSLLLKGKQPRLIDEWQDAPTLWDAVRIAVDKSGGTPVNTSLPVAILWSEVRYTIPVRDVSPA